MSVDTHFTPNSSYTQAFPYTRGSVQLWENNASAAYFHTVQNRDCEQQNAVRQRFRHELVPPSFPFPEQKTIFWFLVCKSPPCALAGDFGDKMATSCRHNTASPTAGKRRHSLEEVATCISNFGTMLSVLKAKNDIWRHFDVTPPINNSMSGQNRTWRI
jgi:hypothetical protein